MKVQRHELHNRQLAYPSLPCIPPVLIFAYPALSSSHVMAHDMVPIPTLTGGEDDGVCLLIDFRKADTCALAPKTQIRLHRSERSASASAAAASSPSAPSRGRGLPRCPLPQDYHLVVLHVLHAFGDEKAQNLYERHDHTEARAAQNLCAFLAGGLLLLCISEDTHTTVKGGHERPVFFARTFQAIKVEG